MADLPPGFVPVTPEENTASSLPPGFVPVTSQPAQEPVDEYEGAFQEFFEGIASGGIGIFQGVGEGVGAIIDVVADTNLSQGATDIGEAARDYAGIDPAGFIGKGMEALTQFAVPGIGAAMLFNKGVKAARIAKGLYDGQRLSKAEKAVIGAKSLGYMGLADAAVATDGMTTISDFFDGGSSVTGLGDTLEYLESDKTQGLTGRDEAGRRILNKFKFGVEAAGLGAFTSAAVPVVKGLTVNPVTKFIAKPVVKGAAAVARPVVNVAGAGLKVAADISAPVVSAGIRKAGDTKAGQFITEQARKIPAYKAELDEARLFGPTPGGVMARNSEFGGPLSDTINVARNITDTALGNASSLLRSRGDLTTELNTARILSKDAAIPDINRAEVSVKKVDATLDKLSDRFDKIMVGTTPLHRTEVYKTMERFMTSPLSKDNEILSKLPKDIHAELITSKKNLNNLRTFVSESETFKMLPQKTQDTITGNLPSYFRRRFRVFEDIKYKPSAKVLGDAVTGFKNDTTFLGDILTQRYKKYPGEFPDDVLTDLGLARIGQGEEARLSVVRPTNEAAEMAAEFALQRSRPTERGRFGYKNLKGGRVAEQQIKSGMFMERTNPPVFYRALLGEIDDVREKIVATTADLAEFKAADQLFAKYSKLADTDEGIGRFFVSPEKAISDPAVQRGLADGTYVTLGGPNGASRVLQGAAEETVKKGEDFTTSAWGPLYNYVVPTRVYKSLTNAVVAGSEHELVNGARAAYSAFLRGKGATQYGKTVLSPITQIRNVTTAAAFALAQGNVGKGASLGESVRIVMNGISELPDNEVLDILENLQRRGVVGTNAQLREMQENISTGLGFNGADDAAQQQSKAFARRLQDDGLRSFLGGVTGKAQDFYQAGDDIWKIYNNMFEKNKILNALRDAPVDEQVRQLTRGRTLSMSEDQLMRSVNDPINGPKVLDDLVEDYTARITRDVVPNYNAVPEGVKMLRRTPFGNFIAFPYEIMRTGSNTISIGLDELMSTNAEIQKIGMRRLMGASIAFSGSGIAMSELGYALSGVSKERMDAFQRSFAADFEKNSRLIPVGEDKETGMPKYINYSYSNPYGMLDGILNAALNKMDEGKRLGKNGTTQVVEAGTAALLETFQPFMDESILYAALKDAADPNSKSFLGQAFNIAVMGGRAGDPKMGSPVYREKDTAGTKVGNSLLHILDTFVPGGAPFSFKSGDVEPSRLIRGLLGDEEGTILSNKTSGGRERDAKTEILRAFTGVTPLDIDPDKAMYYRGIEFKNDLKGTSNLLNSVLRKENVTPGEIVAAYRRANEARYRVSNSFHQAVEDMKTLGLSKKKIRKILKDNNIGGVDGIMANKFVPLYPSDTMLKIMKKNGTLGQFPKKTIMGIYRELKNAEFTVDEPRTTAPRAKPKLPSGFVPVAPAPAPAPAPALPPGFVPFKQGSLPQPAPPITQARAPGPVNPALLGGTPAERAANAFLQNT